MFVAVERFALLGYGKSYLLAVVAFLVIEFLQWIGKWQVVLVAVAYYIDGSEYGMA